MSTSEIIFVVVLILNALIAIGYLLWGIFFHKKNEQDENERISHIIRAVCMLICPVIVLAFLLVGMLIKVIFFRTEVDLEDVVFSKDRVKQIVKADEEREKNVVPIQEALAVSDNTNLRLLMLNVIKGNIEQSLSSISLALDSEDSETSHYAASVLSKELNEFRLNVRKLQQEVKKEDEENLEDTSHRDEYGVLLINYMDKFLKQHVFTNVEQEYFVKIMMDTGELVYQDQKKRQEQIAKEDTDKLQEEKNKKELEKTQNLIKEKAKLLEPMFRARGVKQVEVETTKQIALNANQYASIALRLIESKDYLSARVWCERALQDFPNVLSSYQCTMKLLFILEDKEAFLKVLQKLKASGITIDSETLEMIRVFQ